MKLPVSWVETRLSSLLLALETGGRPPGGVGEIASGVPSISAEHFDWNGKFDFSSLKYIPEYYYQTLQTGRLRHGDILIVKDGATTSKCAYVDEDFPFEDAAINEHVFLVRSNPVVLDSRFLFELLRSDYGKAQILRSFRGAAIGGIPRGFTDQVRLPLPTLAEQKRIVDVLRQAEKLTKLRHDFDELITRTKRQLFVEMFGDPNPRFNTQWPVVKLGSFVTVGTGGTPSREQDDSYGGTLAWVKSTDLKDDVITSTEERVSELGIQRSNAKTYPKQTLMLAMYGQGQTRGRTGKLLIEAACNQACAALLPSDELLTDYLWVWFQLSYESVRALGRGGQQENLNLDIVRGIKIPKPPVPLQQEFSRRLTQLLETMKASRLSRTRMDTLLEVLRVEALTGDATSAWREQHSSEISAAAIIRDALLRERGVKLASRPLESVPLVQAVKDTKRPARQWLMDELSEFQRQVLKAFSKYTKDTKQPLIVEDADIFSRFCDDDYVAECLKDFGPSLNNRIRRTLSQLSALGLIAKVTLPKQNAETGELEYLKAFRTLREAEFTKMSDVESIRRALKLGAEEKYYSLSVHLDYETSERAGAGGMFQVISIEDEDANDFTHLVDQGVHYSSQDKLKQDIANALKVTLKQVDLKEV